MISCGIFIGHGDGNVGCESTGGSEMTGVAGAGIITCVANSIIAFISTSRSIPKWLKCGIIFNRRM